MGANAKTIVDITVPLQDPDKTDKNVEIPSSNNIDVPTISSLLQRKRLAEKKTKNLSRPSIATPVPQLVMESESQKPGTLEIIVPLDETLPTVHAVQREPTLAKIELEKNATATHLRAVGNTAAQGASPPLFTKILELETMDFRRLKKALKQHKHLADIRKLDCLGYLSGIFDEIAYFEMLAASGIDPSFHGIVGYGNQALVSTIRAQRIGVKKLPGVLETLMSLQDIVIKPQEKLLADDKAGLTSMGFLYNYNVAVLPVGVGGKLRGFWLCTSKQSANLMETETKDLKKLFSDLLL